VKHILKAHAKDFKFSQSWYCSYVTLTNVKECGNSTYLKGDEIGIDTNHLYNEKMTMKQKRADAISQIKKIIKEYQDDIDIQMGIK